jgi:peptidoglycan/xylan/chitin deacetylase (PgdA/CDA1 family)
MKIYTIHTVADNGMSLSTRNFRRFLAHIRRTVGFADPQALAREGQAEGALITFDDCYADNFCNALPLLDEFGAKAIFFFTPGYTGTVRWGSRERGNWALEPGGGYDIPFAFMGHAELRTLVRLGHELGFHSRTHRNMTDCAPTEWADEVHAAKLEWEDRLGLGFDTFAYPRGCFSPEMFPVVAQAGYRCAFSTRPGLADAEAFRTQRFCLPRLPVQRRGLFGWL